MFAKCRNEATNGHISREVKRNDRRAKAGNPDGIGKIRRILLIERIEAQERERRIGKRKRRRNLSFFHGGRTMRIAFKDSHEQPLRL